MKKIVFCIVLFFIPVVLFSATGDFTRTLSLGARGEDVRELQKILNKDIETRIAETGIGSQGNETDYFGPATKRALIRFQEKYRTEILTPARLVQGTGVFGPGTRAKATAIKNPSSVTTSKQTTVVPKGEVILMFPSQYSGTSGTTIILSGTGFTSTDNTIYFGDKYVVEKASSWNGQNITFKVPSIPKGNYHLFIKNARGESNKDSFFVVTDGVTPEPKIENINPAHAGRGATITIKGSGFSKNGNMIRTGTNIVENVLSIDGASLSFDVPSNIFVATTTSPKAKKISFPVWVYVVNENGVSNGKSFSFEL